MSQQDAREFTQEMHPAGTRRDDAGGISGK